MTENKSAELLETSKNLINAVLSGNIYGSKRQLSILQQIIDEIEGTEVLVDLYKKI